MKVVFIGILIIVQLCYFGISRAQMPEKRFFTIAAVEPKGGANTKDEPIPPEKLPDGGGYVMRQPDQSGRWEVSAYLFTPAQIVVREGDQVTLEFVGINGATHPTEIRGFGKAFTLKRGQVVRLELNVERPGVYPIICMTHAPSMRAELVVLPRS